MAKITGALLSLGGSGTIAKTITFSKWKGQPYARQRVIPSNPQSIAQTTTRGTFANGSNIWKNAGSLLIAPWDRFAQGQSLTGRNAFIGQFVAVLRGLANMQTMVFSPGAKGGVAPVSVAAAAGVAGSIDVTIVPPTPPTGWTVQACVAATIEDGDPELITNFITVEGEDLVGPYVINLAGLPTTLHVAGGWIRWLKPDGSIAYGPSLNSTATPI